MAESSGMRVDPSGLKSAGATAAEASAHAAGPPGGVTPCANDHVSVGAADTLSARISLAHAYTQMANALAEQLGVRLTATATVYADQEVESAAMLGSGGESSGPLPASLPPLDVPVAPAPMSGMTAGGEVPASSRDIARLLHSGTSDPMRALARQLDADAAALDRSAATLTGAFTQVNGSWAAEGSAAATGHIVALQGWYERHADYFRRLASDVQAHAGDFDQARGASPTPAALDAKDRELRAADEANRRSRGLYTPVVSELGAEAAVLHQKPVSAFEKYGITTLASNPTLPMPEPPPRGPTGNPPPTQAPGSSSSAEDVHPPAPASAPTDPVDVGERGGLDENTSGPLPQPDEAPMGLDESLSEPLAQLPVEALPSVMPAIIGGAVGGLGGAMGGFSGAARNALSGMQQAGAPLSGMGQPGGSPAGGGEPDSGQSSQTPPESPDFSDDGGGGMPGDTEPSWEPSGPLGAPAEMAGAPEAAAPVTAAGPAAPAPAAGSTGAAAPMGGAMMPPLMGGPRGGGPGSDKERQLYPQRRLKVVAPPNSEPVKGRREPRRTDVDERSKSGDQRGR